MRIRWTLLALVVVVAVGVQAGSAWANSAVPWCTTDQDSPQGAQCNPAGSWYTTPVQFAWQISPQSGSSPSPSCDNVTRVTTDTDTVLECDVSWSGGPTIPFVYPLLAEVSSPTASGTFARPPDSNGWYNNPVAVSFVGSGYSGKATCAPTSTVYSGPRTANAVISSLCTDPAGKTATASVSLNYDDSPPTITSASPSRNPDANGYYTHPVTFTFSGTDAVSGIASCDTVNYSGPASGSVTGGCSDRAGNYATISVPVLYRSVAPPAATPKPSATPKASVARASSGLVLRWKPVAHASYYNVQVFRSGKKVLSTWPAHPSVRLRRSWSFAGHRFRLKAARYRWYVWPGFGSRKAARYGHMWVSSSFKLAKSL